MSKTTFKEVWEEPVEIPVLFRAFAAFIVGLTAIILSNVIDINHSDMGLAITSLILLSLSFAMSFGTLYIIFCLVRPNALLEGWRLFRKERNQ